MEEENKELKEERENMSFKMRQLVVLYSNKSHDPSKEFLYKIKKHGIKI